MKEKQLFPDCMQSMLQSSFKGQNMIVGSGPLQSVGKMNRLKTRA